MLNNPPGFHVIADGAVEHHQHGECLCTIGAEVGAARILCALRASPEEARVIRPCVTDDEAEAAAIEARRLAA